ncbi:lactosylceramide 4-alpha-galactosyltransferase isoform X2 [Apis mellifera]|nr:lactosylceramide 4-alpha-galactosyltransferase isoform X2 [Apis mellifera]XP_026299587.1 lactosylceramide 4-alpha-galactosyltransferase isoform X2 [Apis mellifera]|eukprot:XP_006572148.1 lactosylceramide 4-alpha-galactosyltransferase isoform X2 [Apis mellifera]
MKKRLLLCFFCAVIFFILMISTDNDFIQQHVSPLMSIVVWDDISCYNQPNMPDSLLDFDPKIDKPNTDKNIFFHETSCFDENGLMLNARQACAVESAAKMNPNMNVYLLFVSPSKISIDSKEMFKQLQTYPNIHIRYIKPENYMKDTPLDLWYKSDILKRSRWPRNHMSDILRYLTLWKYGGIYLDLDVVVITSIEHLTNFAGAEDWKYVAAGVIGFDFTTLGRRMADACIRDIRANFRGDIWGNNGPGVITRTLQKFCSTKNIQDMSTSRCQGFKVFPPSAFYPIHYDNWKVYFQTKNKNATMKILEKAMAIHVWNKLSSAEKVDVNSDVPYVNIARKHCPKIFNNCGKVF